MNYHIESFANFHHGIEGGSTGTNYKRVDAFDIEKAIKKSGDQKIRETISTAMHGGRSDNFHNRDYDGLLIGDTNGTRTIVASPELLLRNAGIVVMEIGGKGPVYVHVSKEVEALMKQKELSDNGRGLYIAVANANETLITSKQSKGVGALCEILECADGILVPDFYYGKHRLGPRQIDGSVYRIDEKVYTNLPQGSIRFRQPTIEDLDLRTSLFKVIGGNLEFALKRSPNPGNIDYITPAKTMAVGIGSYKRNQIIDYDAARSLL